MCCMVKQKEKFKVECPDCEKEIVGFSKHHAKQNLIIHQRTSEMCKQIKRLLQKNQKLREINKKRIKELPDIKKICLNCEKEYLTKFDYQKYCCGKCREENNSKEYKGLHEDRIIAAKKLNNQKIKIMIPENTLCVDCKVKKAEHRHHEDYSKPLDVTFLCRSCHKRRHKVNYKHYDYNKKSN